MKLKQTYTPEKRNRHGTLPCTTSSDDISSEESGTDALELEHKAATGDSESASRGGFHTPEDMQHYQW
jgi:hypothetical protein